MVDIVVREVSPMIRFQCPTCQQTLTTSDDSTGRKMKCPRCGQKLLVPPPATPLPQSKTLLGQTVPPAAATSQAKGLAVNCPGCGRSIPFGLHELPLNIECAVCKACFVLQGQQGEAGFVMIRNEPSPSRPLPSQDVKAVPRGEPPSIRPLFIGASVLAAIALA